MSMAVTTFNVFVCMVVTVFQTNGFLLDKEHCPENFVWKKYKSNGLCIYVSSDHSDYYQAKENCKRRGALLYSPRTPEKFEIINKVFPDDYDQYFIGLQAQNSVFKWEEDGATPDIEYLKTIFIRGSLHFPETPVACGSFCTGPHQKFTWTDCKKMLRFICEA